MTHDPGVNPRQRTDWVAKFEKPKSALTETGIPPQSYDFLLLWIIACVCVPLLLGSGYPELEIINDSALTGWRSSRSQSPTLTEIKFRTQTD